MPPPLRRLSTSLLRRFFLPPDGRSSVRGVDHAVATAPLTYGQLGAPALKEQQNGCAI